eukprot:gb/GEZN01000642.1/.p1 GENE.gb/GEZN01000642.1/~~gb/GEZN01000642.1/.p1  ORF type:complete len:1162 (-),score=192.01 gb/GEZN01000642.1/:465-3437(-)
MGKPDYIPSEEEAVMARKRTTGINASKFERKEVTWEIVDVGGQRSERRKWITQFEGVKAILYVVNLAGYASVMFEDSTKNRMKEEIDILADISSKDIFKTTPIFIFFNKKDLFEQMLKDKPLTTLFPDYTGSPTDVHENIKYVSAQFTTVLKGGAAKTWPVSARHKQDIRYSFRELMDMVMEKNKESIAKAVKDLKRSGMDKSSLKADEEKEKKMLERKQAREEIGSSDLDAQMAEAAYQSALTFKLLCLGPGESGKSTVIKQLRNVYLGQAGDEVKKKYVSTLHVNTISCMQALLKAGAHFNYPLKGGKEIHAAKVILRLSGQESPELDQEVADAIYILWQSEAIQKAYARKHEFWLLDGAKYYFDHCMEFADLDWLPSEEDMIMARARTTGIVATEFQAKELFWNVVDVGGQRSERRKWMNAFDNVKAVIYIVNLGGYNSVLFEDETRNRLEEALDLYEEVCANKVFLNTPIYLFLNKKDLFEERLRSTPLSEKFPEFKGESTNVRECIDFIAALFKARMKKVRGKTTGFKVWSVAARYKKDIKYAFLELTEDIVNQNIKQVTDAKEGLRALKRKQELAASARSTPGQALVRMLSKSKRIGDVIEKRTRKILVVGSGDAGKSALLRQLVASHSSENLSSEEIKHTISSLQGNALHSAEILIREAQSRNLELTGPAQKAAERILAEVDKVQVHKSPAATTKSIMPRTVAKDIELVWQEPKIKELFRQLPRSFYLPDMAEYYLDSATQFVGREWIPSFQEAAKCSSPTVKPSTCNIQFRQRRVEDDVVVETVWTLIDTGGRSSYRTGWDTPEDVGLLEGLTAVIFVADLVGYYEISPDKGEERKSQTRMEDAIAYLKHIDMHPLFKDVPIYLILNKVDLFERTLRDIPITIAISDYKGSLVDLPENLVYLSNQYWNCLGSTLHKDQWQYWSTSALNKRDIKFAFSELTESLDLYEMAQETARANKKKNKNRSPSLKLGVSKRNSGVMVTI